MPVKKIDIMLTEIIDQLNNGVAWLQRDDLGYGSIQEKYGANEMQITMIRKHPKLKDLEPTVVVFNIIDDTVSKSQPVEAKSIPQAKPVHVETGNEAFDAFANL
jgi:hypothetical protein